MIHTISGILLFFNDLTAVCLFVCLQGFYWFICIQHQQGQDSAPGLGHASKGIQVGAYVRARFLNSRHGQWKFACHVIHACIPRELVSV